MTLLLRLCLFTPLLLLLGAFTVLALCIESTPLVAQRVQLSPANIDRVQRILSQHKPGNLRAGEAKTITITEQELNLIASHILHRVDSAGLVVKVEQGLLVLTGSWDISAVLPYKKLASGYLNIETVVVNSSGNPGLNSLNIQSLKIGQLAFPPLLIEALRHFVFGRLDSIPTLHNLSNMIQTLDIRAQDLALTYQWQEGLVETIREGFITASERQSLAIYNQFLLAEVEQQGRNLTFTRLLEATFRYAQSRSQNGDPVAENKDAIIVLAAYANGGGLSTLVAEARHWPKPQRAKLRLQGRRDLVLHFMASAALAVAGGGAMSNAIGLQKEINDANGGSGFSFKDLAADRAGARFGEMAVASTAAAVRLQANLADGGGGSQLIPSMSGLEEGLNRAQFQRRFGGTDERRYQQVVAKIDQQINALALYREPGEGRD